jgi:hypothetical protein
VVELAYDRVIACTGFRMDSSIFAVGCMPALAINDRFPALTSELESVNVPGLYFAGMLTQSRDFKKHTSAFIHGFRYGSRALVRMLQQKHHGVEWPHRRLPPGALADAVLARINRTSALSQQFGFLCDVVTPDVRYYEEMPLDYVSFADCFTVTVREAGGWYDSVRNTIFQMFGDGPPQPRVAEARRSVPGLDVFTAFHRRMIWDGFFAGRFSDRAYAIKVFTEHNAEVVREAPADRLLVISAGGGWAPLCAFLGVPVPDEPYPHLNDPERFWARVQARVDETHR